MEGFWFSLSEHNLVYFIHKCLCARNLTKMMIRRDWERRFASRRTPRARACLTSNTDANPARPQHYNNDPLEHACMQLSEPEMMRAIYDKSALADIVVFHRHV